MGYTRSDDTIPNVSRESPYFVLKIHISSLTLYDTPESLSLDNTFQSSLFHRSKYLFPVSLFSFPSVITREIPQSHM